jgi:hypothetical protein
MSSADHRLYAIIADLQQQLATQAEALTNLQLALSQQQPSPVRKRQHSRSYSPPILDTSMEEVPPSKTPI